MVKNGNIKISLLMSIQNMKYKKYGNKYKPVILVDMYKLLDIANIFLSFHLKGSKKHICMLVI